MKKMTVVAMIVISSAILLIACSDQEKEAREDEKNTVAVQEEQEEATDSAQTESEQDETEADDATESSTTDGEVDESNEQVASEEESALSAYTASEIEYARVWLELGVHQEIEELNVRHITAGEPLNPDDETSASYPEDVVQLAGSRLIDGSITYSSNGDGTVNVYNIPLRWDGQYPAGEEFYEKMLEQTTVEAIGVGDDEKVIELIQLLKQ